MITRPLFQPPIPVIPIPTFLQISHPVPNFQLPLFLSSLSPSNPAPNPIAVVGATGGVGRLLVSRLLCQGHTVHAIVRNSITAHALFDTMGYNTSSTNSHLKIVQASLSNEGDFGEDRVMRKALENVEGVAVTVGTTAFPTRAWDGWKNTPWTVDGYGVEKVVRCLGSKVKKVVLASSIGTSRYGSFPFCVLNLFGVLEAKRFGEKAVIGNSGVKGYDWVVVRLGRLAGGPHTNIGVWKLEGIEGKEVLVTRGDEVMGHLLRKDAARVLEECLVNKRVRNVDVSAVNGERDREDGQILTALMSLVKFE